MANELRVGIAADASGLGPGLDSAAAQVISAAEKMAAAQNIAAAAAKNLAEAQAQLGAAAASGNAQAASIIGEYSAVSAEAAAAVSALTSAVAAETPALEQNAVAATAAAAATGALGLSSRQAATAGIGILEGRMMSGNRAAASFLTNVLGLGPALQAAFPIIGALAMAEVLFDIGRGAYNAYEKFIDLEAVWDKLDDDMRKMQQQDFVNVHSIETATLRLEEANDAAKNLRSTAEDIHKTGIFNLVEGLLSGNVGQLATAGSQLSGAHGAGEGSAERTKESITLQLKMMEQEHQLADLRIEAAHSADAALSPEQKITAEYSKRVALAREEQRYNQERDAKLGNTTPATGGDAVLKLQESAAGAEALAARTELQRRAQELIAKATIEAAHAMDSELSPAAQITAQLQKQLELNLEAERSSKEGTAAIRDQLRALQDQTAVGKANAELSKQEDQAIAEFQKQSLEYIDEQVKAQKQADEEQRRSTEEIHRVRAEAQAAGRTEAQAAIQAANEDFQTTQREIQEQEKLGTVSHRVATQMLLDAERLKEQQTEGALKKEAGLFDPLEGGRELQEFTQLETKMSEVARKGQADRQKILQQETAQFEQQWKKVADEFNKDFTQAFNSIITKQDSVSKAFGHMFGEIELQLADFVVEWLLKQAEMWLMQEILQATGLTTSKSTQTAANVATVTSDASVAAANTMAYYTAINPVIAPAMAAVAYAETLSFAAFERGGMVMGSAGAPVPIIAHAGERVLSAGQTSNFESLVNNGGSRSATLHQENHFGSGVTQEMLEAHTAQTMSKLRGMIRPEALR